VTGAQAREGARSEAGGTGRLVLGVARAASQSFSGCMVRILVPVKISSLMM